MGCKHTSCSRERRCRGAAAGAGALQQAACTAAAGTSPAADASHARHMALWCASWRTRKHSATCVPQGKSVFRCMWCTPCTGMRAGLAHGTCAGGETTDMRVKCERTDDGYRMLRPRVCPILMHLTACLSGANGGIGECAQSALARDCALSAGQQTDLLDADRCSAARGRRLIIVGLAAAWEGSEPLDVGGRREGRSPRCAADWFDADE